MNSTPSPSPPLRQKRRERNLRAILDAAREIVLERGPEGLALREVARRADYSPAALYRYFANREELIAALGMEAVAVLGRYLDAVPRELPEKERLIALCEAYVTFAGENPEQFSLFDRLRLPATSWERYVEVAWPFTVIIEATSAAMASGAIGRGDAAAAALGLWAVSHGFASLRAGHLHAVEAEHAAMQRAAFETHVQGLSKGAPR